MSVKKVVKVIDEIKEKYGITDKELAQALREFMKNNRK